MTIKTTLPDVTFPSTFPLFQLDSILPESGLGALVLVDPTHAAEPWIAGTPGSSVPNLVETEARSLVGGTDSLTCAVGSSFTNAASGGPTTAGFAERTAKGGLHVAFWQSATTGDESKMESAKGLWISFPDAVRRWFATNQTHAFYFSTWTHITRPGLYGPNGPHWEGFHGRTSATTAAYGFSFPSVGGAGSAGSGITVTYTESGSNTVGPRRRAVNWSPWDGSYASDNGQGHIFNVGTNGTQNSYLAVKRTSPSLVLYRAYCEDLTVSGRSFAEVDAIDQAIYAAAVTDQGGRYNDDTIPTSPTTI